MFALALSTAMTSVIAFSLVFSINTSPQLKLNELKNLSPEQGYVVVSNTPLHKPTIYERRTFYAPSLVGPFPSFPSTPGITIPIPK